jgi:hypothetical protein
MSTRKPGQRDPKAPDIPTSPTPMDDATREGILRYLGRHDVGPMTSKDKRQ